MGRISIQRIGVLFFASVLAFIKLDWHTYWSMEWDIVFYGGIIWINTWNDDTYAMPARYANKISIGCVSHAEYIVEAACTLAFHGWRFRL